MIWLREKSCSKGWTRYRLDSKENSLRLVFAAVDAADDVCVLQMVTTYSYLHDVEQPGHVPT